jgi:hypothetical protein
VGGKYDFSKIPPSERMRLADECGLTEEEILVFNMRAKKDRVIPTSMELGMCESSVKRKSKSIAMKLARSGHRGHMSACLEAKNCI